MLITNDLLLHIYHKLFDNGLKYYEEQIARPTLTTLSETLYQQYLTASQQEKNPELQSFYAFLAAYWAVPHIFLPSNDQLIALSQQAMNRARENNDYDSSPNIGDEALATFLQQRMQTITSTLPAPYQTLLPQIVEKILKADEPKAMDEFLAVLAEDELLQNGMQLQQDYTQFRPRAHYTDSSLLKTYFMAMKWLMREKFYFQSPTLTKAALILGSTIDEQDLQKLNQLSQQISQLIGTDDDLTLNELLQWQATKNFTTPSTMLANFNEQLRTELASLHPQNIQSTAYSTDTVMMTTETEAKQATDGFVFFGEKFTLDSYLFDLTTAGSAEKEFAYKPNIQTALIVPDILEDNALAHQLVKLRLSEKADENKIREDAASGFTQYSSYEKVKEEAKAALSALRNKE
ncbi:MAG: DUF3160 domain-containing protein [Candidatus Peribacteria bacterium]|jgi:hypothetical protein|nr:DUF3160 domain-containing protein [Candidatus Peribacteria bacterium]